MSAFLKEQSLCIAPEEHVLPTIYYSKFPLAAVNQRAIPLEYIVYEMGVYFSVDQVKGILEQDRFGKESMADYYSIKRIARKEDDPTRVYLRERFGY